MNNILTEPEIKFMRLMRAVYAPKGCGKRFTGHDCENNCYYRMSIDLERKGYIEITGHDTSYIVRLLKK